MKEIIYIYIYICQGLIAALFTTIQRRQLTVASKYHAIYWYGSSSAIVGALLFSPSNIRATEGVLCSYFAGGTSPSQTDGAGSIPLTESALPLMMSRATGEANISMPCGPEPIPILPPRAASVMALMTSDDGWRTPSCTCPTRQSPPLACCGDWGD